MKKFSGTQFSLHYAFNVDGHNYCKPNMKGGHTHNHLKNMELRLMLSKKEIKALRKIMKREKKNG